MAAMAPRWPTPIQDGIEQLSSFADEDICPREERSLATFIMVNLTVLQCNWIQNTENNLLIQVDSQLYGIVSV